MLTQYNGTNLFRCIIFSQNLCHYEAFLQQKLWLEQYEHIA
jgi:hypothetical protein